MCQKLAPRAPKFYARACARGQPTHVNGVVQSRGRAPRSTIGMYGEIKTNARCPCTPPSTVETFGEEISAEACSGKEIEGLLRKVMMMTRKSRIAYERILAWQTGGR